MRLFCCYKHAGEVRDSKSLALPVKKKWSNSKTKKEIKIRRHGFLEKLSDSKLAKFQPNWFTGCRLGVQNVPSTCSDFHFEKTGEKYFWRRIARDEIITPKLSMLMHTRKGTTIVTQQEKVTNETQQQISNALLCSILLLSRKHL